MSWHYLKELPSENLPSSQGPEAESSGACCTGGEPLPPLRSKTTHAEFYCKGKLTESYLDSLSGMTSAPLTESPGEGRLTSSPEDSPARTSVPQGGAPVSEVPGLDSGPRWQGLLARFDLDTRSWKTHRCLWEEDLPLSSVTLPRWGMMRGGECWELLISERPTRGTVPGLWPTIVKNEGPGRQVRKLTDAVAVAEGYAPKYYPAPGTKGRPLFTGRVNPRWGEWLMGWPIGWVKLQPLETASVQQWQRLCGRC